MQNHNEEVTYQYAGFWKRVAAQFIDLAIFLIAWGIIKNILTPVLGMINEGLADREILFTYTLMDIIEYLVTVTYFIVMTYFTGATVGKQALKLKVISVKGDGKLKLIDVIYRETIGRFFSDMLGGIGYFVVLFNEEKKAIHDMLCDTRVVEVKKNKVVPVRPVVNVPVAAPVIPEPVVEKPAEVAEPVEVTEPVGVTEPLEYTIPRMIEPPANEGGSLTDENVQEQWKKILGRDS